MSGGRHDASVLCIGHPDGGRFVADVVRGYGAPHDPAVIAGEFAGLLKSYGLRAVTGDNFSAEWPVQAFRAHGVEYRRAALAKSQIYVTGARRSQLKSVLAHPPLIPVRGSSPGRWLPPSVGAPKNLAARHSSARRSTHGEQILPEVGDPAGGLPGPLSGSGSGVIQRGFDPLNGAVQKARMIVPVARATIVLIEMGSCDRALWTRPKPTTSVTQESASITTLRWVTRFAASSEKLFMT